MAESKIHVLARRATIWMGPALALGILTGCGGDETVAGGRPAAEVRDYCGRILAVETYPEPDIDYDSMSSEQLTAANRTFAAQFLPLADQVLAVAPAQVRTDTELLVSAVREVTQTGDFEAAFETPAVNDASKRAHAFDLENCKWAKVDVAAKEYAFSGVPKKVKAGPVSFEFTNQGKEPHEFVLFRVNDGVTESVQQLINLPEEEGRAKVTQVGGTFAPPGEGEYAVADLKPGRYGIACFVPVGGAEDGPPHTSHGMHAEFQVV